MKNISKINLLFLLSFFVLFSCKSVDLLKKKEIVEIKKIENIEKNKEIKFININSNYYNDYYSNKKNIIYYLGKEFNQLLVIKDSAIENNNFPLNPYIYDEKLFYLSNKSVLKVYNLNDTKLIYENKIISDSIKDYAFPISVSMTNDIFIVSYSNGLLLSFDISGKILWETNLNGVLKTPIKIFNNQIIILLSNKIFSINLHNGEINWFFEYNNNNISSSLGGNIISKNHLLFFILPNGKFGQIDTIIGEKINSKITKKDLQNTLSASKGSINNFENLLSIFLDNKYLSTYNIKSDDIYFHNYQIADVSSHQFFNNSLITLNKDLILNVYNIENHNLFWSINLNEYLKNKDKLINVNNVDKNLVLFFSNGLILILDSLSGNIISENNFNISKLTDIYFNNNYYILNLNNGKKVILKQ